MISKEQQELDWDGKYIHFCTESYQSCQDVAVACGIRLSTWAASGRKLTGNKYGTQASPERDLGYSFTTAPITCPECISWMEKNLNRCKSCDAIAQYNYCNKCAEIWMEKVCDICGLKYGSGKCFHPTKE